MRSILTLITLICSCMSHAESNSISFKIRAVVLPTCNSQLPVAPDINVDHGIDLANPASFRVHQGTEFQVHCNTRTRVQFTSLNGGLEGEGHHMAYTAAIGDSSQQGSQSEVLVDQKGRQQLADLYTSSAQERVRFELLTVAPSYQVPPGEYSDTIQVAITVQD